MKGNMKNWKRVSPKKLSARKRGVFVSTPVDTDSEILRRCVIDPKHCPICGKKMQDLEYVGHNPEILAIIASGLEGDFAFDALEDGKPAWIVKRKHGHRSKKAIG